MTIIRFALAMFVGSALLVSVTAFAQGANPLSAGAKAQFTGTPFRSG